MSPRKACFACGLDLPRSEFYARPGSADGLRSDCKECVKARARRSVERRPAEVREYQRIYREANADWLLPACRERQQGYDRRDYYRDYRSENLSTLHANEQRYRSSHRDSETARRHSRRAIPMDEAARSYIGLIVQDPCSYCGRPGGTVDHIDPVNGGGDNAWDNFTGACQSCNSSKNAQSLLLFLVERAA